MPTRSKNSRVLLFAAAIMSLMPALGPLRPDAQVTSNVLERVLTVRVNAGTPNEATATAFTIDVDGREYLVTAKHVVKGLRSRDKIDIFMNNQWSSLEVSILRCDDPVDIAVLIPPHQLTVNFELPSENNNVYLGQEAYFLGFPYGIQIPATGINGPYPLPIVKHGNISGILPISQESRSGLMLLDGYNNPGFSGGPIVYRDSNQGSFVFRLAGVVSGFRPEVAPVMKEHDISSPDEAGQKAKAEPWRIVKRANGTYFEYVDNGTYVALNTGIVIGYGIQPAVDLIHQHPIGPEAKDLPGNNPSPQ